MPKYGHDITDRRCIYLRLITPPGNSLAARCVRRRTMYIYLHTSGLRQWPKSQRVGNRTQLSFMLLDLGIADMHHVTVSCSQRTVLDLLTHLQSVSHQPADKDRDDGRRQDIGLLDWPIGDTRNSLISRCPYRMQRGTQCRIKLRYLFMLNVSMFLGSSVQL
ncbi:hypothetical protein DM02DRAFT_176075 [Periconia macrospinosa]|uniref:Uncharacterized protein n=1 Tax=Periconia macrospinosa TaxID=97972 RepID=A0A2V1E1K2_9PLEO|nr:hypothetical protein DM02DRAFT_176075 [Periconia macrospinosa]